MKYLLVDSHPDDVEISLYFRNATSPGNLKGEFHFDLKTRVDLAAVMHQLKANDTALKCISIFTDANIRIQRWIGILCSNCYILYLKVE